MKKRWNKKIRLYAWYWDGVLPDPIIDMLRAAQERYREKRRG